MRGSAECVCEKWVNNLQLYYLNMILVLLSEERNLKRILQKTKIEISIKELKIC